MKVPEASDIGFDGLYLGVVTFGCNVGDVAFEVGLGVFVKLLDDSHNFAGFRQSCFEGLIVPPLEITAREIGSGMSKSAGTSPVCTMLWWCRFHLGQVFDLCE